MPEGREGAREKGIQAMNMRRCGDCEYFEKREVGGICHRFPSREDDLMPYSHWWCGEFKRSSESLETYMLKKDAGNQNEARQHDPQSQEPGEKS
jgi:hypothetical protein